MTGINQSFALPDRAAVGFGAPTHIDLGFKPRVMFMTGCGVPTASLGTTFYTTAWGGFGWSLDPAIGNECSSVGSGGYQAGHVPGGSYISDSIFAGIYENTNLREKSIDLVSLDCDTATGHATSGYTYTTGVALPTGVVATLALGGDDISSAAGSFSWPGAAGDVAVTGVGFEPQLVMFLWSKTDTYNRPYTFGDANGSSFGFGAASSTDSAEQFCCYTESQGGDAGQSTHLSGSCCFAQGTGMNTASLASMDADGFTLTFTGDDTGNPLVISPRLIGWIALRNDGPVYDAGGFKVGNDIVPGSTGTVGYTGCGFEPDQVIIAHGNTSAQDTVAEAGGAWGVGMFDQTLQASIINGENLIPFNNYSARRMNTTAVAFAAYQTTTINAEASAVSLDADGFTLDWTDVTAPGKPFGWFAMRTSGGNFNGSCGAVRPTAPGGPVVSMDRQFAYNLG